MRLKNLLHLIRSGAETLIKQGPRQAWVDTTIFLRERLGEAVARSAPFNRDDAAAPAPEVSYNAKNELERMRREIERLTRESEQAVQTLDWLAQNRGARSPEPGRDTSDCKISVIMYAGAHQAAISSSIQSVCDQTHENWELIVVGDEAGLAESFNDTRINVVSQAPHDESAARNHALGVATGSVVAYLDSGNTWYPDYLACVADTFQDEDVQCAYAAQLLQPASGDRSYLRAVRYDRERFVREGGIELDAFAHRSELFKSKGGFDEQLAGLVGWDLIAKYTESREPASIPTIAGRCVERGTQGTSPEQSFWLNHYRISRKWETPLERSPKVLYALWNYPQVTETYIRWEITCLRRWGVEIEVWSDSESVNASYESEVPVHYGDLGDAIDRVRPHLVHTHFLDRGAGYRDIVARRGLPLTVRGHSADFSDEFVKRLVDDPVVRAVYVFTHRYDAAKAHKKVTPLSSVVNGDLYYPVKKDRKLVVRTSAALPKKNLEAFLELAKLCPDHKFVLIAGQVNGPHAGYAAKLKATNEAMGSPAEVHISMQTEEVAAYIRSAGIYVHTYTPDSLFGMPVSIAEALATGAYTLVPRRPEALAYIGTAGAAYDSLEQAAGLIQATTGWGSDEWNEMGVRAVDHAYKHFIDSRVLAPLRDEFDRIAKSRAYESVLPQPEQQKLSPIIETFLAKHEGGLPHKDNTFLAHCLGVYRYLHQWGAPEAVCLAGMFHSVYGTQLRRKLRREFNERTTIREMIGERAEYLAYLNSSLDRSTLDSALANGGAPYKVRDWITEEWRELDQNDFEDLCRIHLAEWIEQVPRSRRWSYRAESYAAMAAKLGDNERRSFEEVYALASSLPLKPTRG